MPNPTVFDPILIAYDRAGYQAGDPMTLTVVGAATLFEPQMATVQVTVSTPDGSTGVTPPVEVELQRPVRQLVAIRSVVDPDGREWVVSDDGRTATAVA